MGLKRMGLIGDAHLNKMAKVIPNHLDLQLSCIDTILKRMDDKGIKEVTFLGDVLDQPIVECFILIAFLRVLKKWPNMKFHWVVGNHDKSSTDITQVDLIYSLCAMEHIDNLTIYLEPTKVGKLGFLPYPHKKPLKGTVCSLAHVDRPDAMRDNGTPVTTKGKWADNHHFVIGHIHTSQRIGKTTYVGSPYQNSFGEKAEKYWGILEYDSENVRCKLIPIDLPYTLVNLVVSCDSDLEQVKPAPYYYKVKTIDGYRLPNNFYRNNPNCIPAAGSRSAKAEILRKKLSETDRKKLTKLDLTYGLAKRLKEKGFGKADRIWSVKEVEKISASLGA